MNAQHINAQSPITLSIEPGLGLVPVPFLIVLCAAMALQKARDLLEAEHMLAGFIIAV